MKDFCLSIFYITGYSEKRAKGSREKEGKRIKKAAAEEAAETVAENAAEKLAETIIATEALVKGIDSRAEIDSEMKSLLMKRLEIEINYKKAKQAAKEEQRELRERQREEKKVREEALKAQKQAEKEERIKAEAIARLEVEMAEKSEQERLVYQAKLDAL